MAYPHKWSPISYKSSAGKRKDTGQRPMLYRWSTQPTIIGPPKLKFLLRCDQNMEFKRPAEAYPLLNFRSPRVWKLHVQLVRPISPWRRWRTDKILIPLDRRRFVVMQSCSTFSDCCQLSTPLNAEVQKTQKLDLFVGRGRQNKPIDTKFAGKRMP